MVRLGLAMAALITVLPAQAARTPLPPAVVSQRDAILQEIDLCQKVFGQAMRGGEGKMEVAAEQACEKADLDSQALPDLPDLLYERTAAGDKLAQLYGFEHRFADAIAIYRRLVHISAPPGGAGYAPDLESELGAAEVLNGDWDSARTDLATAQRGWEAEIHKDATAPDAVGLFAKLANLQAEQEVVEVELRVAQHLDDRSGEATARALIQKLDGEIQMARAAMAHQPPPRIYDPSAPVPEGQVLLTTDRTCLRCPLPAYPGAFRSLQMQGTAVVRATLAPDGKVKNVTYVSGNKVFAAVISRPAMDWQFAPAAAGDKAPTATITVQFKLVPVK